MYPELANQEVRTSGVVCEVLQGLGLKVQRGIAGTGVVGLLEGWSKGRTVALRADMDALPIQDKKDVPYSSRVEGKMHACGHDAHTAMLLGAAMVLAEGWVDIGDGDDIAARARPQWSPCRGRRAGSQPVAVGRDAVAEPTLDFIKDPAVNPGVTQVVGDELKAFQFNHSAAFILMR